MMSKLEYNPQNEFNCMIKQNTSLIRVYEQN